jgi:prepilin-type N-terminal cleavage/methylation domain-containing protein
MVNNFRKALSMIELIFVMVVLGIVASMGATIISQVYSNYINQRALYNSSIKTEIASSIIFNRLSYRLTNTTIGRNASNKNDIELVTNITDSDKYSILEWYGMAVDSFNANDKDMRPAWNGFCDVDGSNRIQIATPGSNLTLLKDIIENISNSKISDLAIVFADPQYSSTKEYNFKCMGYINSSCISRVSDLDINLESFKLANNDSKRVVEQYKLIRSAYALVPVNKRDYHGTPVFDLELRYDYQPWQGESYNDKDTSRGILVRNVSTFRFSGMGDTLRFKICVSENIGNRNLTTCKEKAVIR